MPPLFKIVPAAVPPVNTVCVPPALIAAPVSMPETFCMPPAFMAAPPALPPAAISIVPELPTTVPLAMPPANMAWLCRRC